MGSNHKDYQFFIQEIIKKLEDRKLTVFCGAGISFNSGVPLVTSIKAEVLAHFCNGENEIQTLLTDKIPFELFMQTIIEHSQSDALLDIFDLGEPNENHFLLAKLAKAGVLNCIVTTNFDRLIEKAFTQERIDYDLYYNETEFAGINMGGEAISIIKIHGSVHNKKQMAVTIKRVSEKRSYGLRKEVIHNIAGNGNGNALLVIGYSCSDFFDINPLFEAMSGPKSDIFYIQHETPEKQTLEISPIHKLSGNNPFKSYNGYFLNIFTDSFVEILHQQFFEQPVIKTAVKYLHWENIINDWAEGILSGSDVGRMYYITGQLFNVCSRYNKAIEYFTRCLQTAGTSGNVDLRIDSLFALGRCYRDTQKNKKGWQKALNLLYKGARLSRKNAKKKKHCFCLLSIGVTYEDKKDHFAAIKFYEDAGRIAAYLGEKEIEAICLGNLGIVMKNLGETDEPHSRYYYNKAIQFQKRSMELSIETGDKGSEGRTYGNMGILFSCLGNTEKAIDHFEKAFRVAYELNDYKHQGIWKFNKGYDLKRINLLQAAGEILDAKKIFESIDPPLDNYIATCNEELKKINSLIDTNKIEPGGNFKEDQVGT